MILHNTAHQVNNVYIENYFHKKKNNFLLILDTANTSKYLKERGEKR